MGLANQIFHQVSDRSRQRKLDLFQSLMHPTPRSLVLDLGGEAPQSSQPHKQLLTSYAHRDRMVLVNLFYPNVKKARETLGITALCGDGLRLPFADKSFDICYCNAVIEHLFTADNQSLFATEIMRVAKSWFVTTPNRWFPFEPHLRLPFVTWLPQSWQHKIGWQMGYNHLRRRYAKGSDRTEIRLLSRRQMKTLFPTSRIIRNGIIGFTPTFIAAGGEAIGTAAATAILSASPRTAS